MIGLLGVALAHPCESIGLDDVLEIPAPAVLVLGEQHGSKPDMKRARAVVDALAERAPVRLALEAVHESNQPVLDAFVRGEKKKRKLPAALRWDETWGYDWGAYKKLVARTDVDVVAAGLDLGPKPEDREVTIPEGYDAYLQQLMQGHEMTDEIRARFTTSMTWRDFRIGELAAAGWSGEGYLVVLAGKGHVEGSLGTNWQLERLVEAPVHSVILGHDDAACLEGDRVWAD